MLGPGRLDDEWVLCREHGVPFDKRAERGGTGKRKYIVHCIYTVCERAGTLPFGAVDRG